MADHVEYELIVRDVDKGQTTRRRKFEGTLPVAEADVLTPIMRRSKPVEDSDAAGKPQGSRASGAGETEHNFVSDWHGLDYGMD